MRLRARILLIAAALTGVYVTTFGVIRWRHAWNQDLLATATVRVVHANGHPAAGVLVEARWTRCNGGTGLARMTSGADGHIDLGRIAQHEHPALWSYRLKLCTADEEARWHSLAPRLDLVLP